MGGAALTASEKKDAKYCSLTTNYIFVPIACETLGPIGSKALAFLGEVGRRLTAVSGDPRETSFLFQRLSVAIQRFNCVCFKGSFVAPADTDE